MCIKTDTELGVVALLILVAMSFVAAYCKVEIDASAVVTTAVVAIAAFVKGDREKRQTDKPEPEPKP